MISPPVTAWPAKTLTPSRLAFESRPLRDEPRPFLCAICAVLLLRAGGGLRPPATASRELDLRDLDAGQLLTVAGAPLVAPLGLELDDPELRAALVGDDPCGHRRPAERVAVDHIAAVDHQQRLEIDRRALVGGPTLD